MEKPLTLIYTQKACKDDSDLYSESKSSLKQKDEAKPNQGKENQQEIECEKYYDLNLFVQDRLQKEVWDPYQGCFLVYDGTKRKQITTALEEGEQTYQKMLSKSKISSIIAKNGAIAGSAGEKTGGGAEGGSYRYGGK